jgi:SAM-dependent methyltransferase
LKGLFSMHWKLKAKIQTAISLLPSSASYAVYYWIQRHFGGLRRLNPISRLTAGIEIWKRIQKQGYTPAGKVFLEVGTGRAPLVPLAYWLMGAEKTISIDLNPYLKEELVAESLYYISENREEILNLFGSLVNRKRFDELLEFCRNSQLTPSTVLDLCRVNYIAPGDAADTRLPDQSIDFHTSYTVFEHIPLKVLKRILEEGNRIIRENGLFIHRIDYSDHFSHSDQSISAINFLQYSDDEWERYAGNRYMYMNRLRHDDFISLFEFAGHRIVEAQPNIDQRLQGILRNGNLHLNERFSSKPEEVLAITGAWMITQLTFP